jgi:hypothetical protein
MFIVTVVLPVRALLKRQRPGVAYFSLLRKPVPFGHSAGLPGQVTAIGRYL